MKNNKKNDNGDYRQLRTKIFTATVAMGFGAVAFILFFYSLFLSGRFANFMVRLFQLFFQLDWNRALSLYNSIIRDNMELIFILSIVIMFFVIFRVYLNFFTRYFGQINRGLDALINENSGEVILSSDLSAIEKKINAIRHTLETRKLDAQIAEQRKNDLIVYLAHDLKTPLTSVIGYLTLLKDENQISDELREKYLSISLKKAERLEELINEFFEITRFNLSNIELEWSSVNLTRMLEQLAYEFKPMLAEKELECSLSAGTDLLLKCDVDKLERVFDNLLRNAVNYSFPQSQIEIIVRQDEKKTEIVFKNRGNTIPKEKLNRVFEQFYRLDTARTTKSGGAGLGLAIAKEIVELHGGEIRAESADEVVVFTVWMPNA